MFNMDNLFAISNDTINNIHMKLTYIADMHCNGVKMIH